MPTRHVGLCAVLVLESRLPEIGTNRIHGRCTASIRWLDMVIVEG